MMRVSVIMNQRRTARPKLRPIIPGLLYQTAAWRDVPRERIEQAVSEAGLYGIANFWRDTPDFLKEVVTWYRHWPIPDGMRVSAAVDWFVQQMLGHLQSGRPLAAMCYGGRNRSGLVSALLVRRLTGCTAEEAIARVQTARRGALANSHFVRYILEETQRQGTRARNARRN
jgi:hypothetical protein